MQFSSSNHNVHDFLFDSLVVICRFQADLFETGLFNMYPFDIYSDFLRCYIPAVVQTPGRGGQYVLRFHDSVGSIIAGHF